MPMQHASYTDYVNLKKQEAKRMHKKAVNAKTNRQELWNIAQDAPRHFSTFLRMKHNQRKFAREDRI